jgi:hypothetical protein
MFSYLKSLLLQAPLPSSEAAESSLSHLVDLHSLPGFTRAITQKLSSEIDRLETGPEAPGIDLLKGIMGLFLGFLFGRLSGPPQHIHQDRLTNLLDCLEAICRVRA